MFVVIFEVQPCAARRNDYLDLAKYLKPKLEATDGFIDNDRFGSRRSERRVLSLSTWRDEKAVVRWRTQGDHHRVQEKGRREIFKDYRIRIGEVTEDDAPPLGMTLFQQRFDETARPNAKAMTLTELAPPNGQHAGDAATEPSAMLGLPVHADGLVDHETFDSIYHPGKQLLLATWRDAEAAARWTPGAAPSGRALRHRRVRVIRDYGMRDRAEAPQFYPDVEAARGAAE